MTVFVDFIYARGCSACHSCIHYLDELSARFPEVVFRYLDIQKKHVTEFYKRYLVMDVESAPMSEERKRAFLKSGRKQLMGTPTIVVWSDKMPSKAFIVKYGCAGRNVSPAEQDISWENVKKKIATLLSLEDGLLNDPIDIVFEDIGWVKW